MLIDNTKSNPFGSAITPQESQQQPQGILNIEAPQNAPMSSDPSMMEQGVGILKDKAMNTAVNKGTEMATGAATTAIESAVAGGAGKGAGATAAGAAGMPLAAGATGTGLMAAAAAPMVAPLMIGGLLATKLFK